MYIRKRFKILNECEIAELLGEERFLKRYYSVVGTILSAVKKQF